MARDVLTKARNNETLDEDDLQYAVDRPWIAEQLKGMGVDVPVAQVPLETDFGTPTNRPLMASGAAFEMPDQEASGPGVFLSEENLQSLKADTLDEIAEALGVEEMPRKKADKVSTLVGADVSESEDETDADEDESF